MLALFCVFLGGGIGSALRYAANLALSKWTFFPFATLSVNLTGSFLIGLFYAWSIKYQWNPETKALLIVGFLGGLTTFSSFSMDTLRLVMEQKIQMALLNVMFNNFLGMAFAWLAYVAVQRFSLIFA